MVEIENIRPEIKTLYPFKSNYLDINGNKYHYLDEGEGEAVLMLHGNPTWSFYYRNLTKVLRKNYRVIVPDHMGCGFSDIPEDYSYTLENHVSNVIQLVKYLGIKNIKLIVHDWGGAIGFGLATRYPELISKIVILNTAAYPAPVIPKRIAFCKTKVGAFLVQAVNAFAWPATFMTTQRPLPSMVKKAYLMPYGNFKNRKAVRAFVEDIPMEESHPTYSVLKEIEDKLPEVKCPKMILWGGKDFCFNDYFFNKWKEIYPDAESHYYENAGHYVIEDALSECLSNIQTFFKA
jgi:pimeloyl-ACP methyl ester carboxylesterase